MIGFAVLFCASAGSAQRAEPPAQPVCLNQPTAADKAGMEQMREMTLTPGAKVDYGSIMALPGARDFMQRAEARKKSDWADLCHYRSANDAVRALGRPEAVFMGDSITENWAAADRSLFSGGIVGRGISGQTTTQMLVRFYPDVVALKPRVVHIMAGTNDIAGNTGPVTDEDFRNNIRAMVELAQGHGIAVVLASIPPSSGMAWAPSIRPAERIASWNRWLRDYARERGAIYVDYTPLLDDGKGGLRATLGNDGVHPNRAGYAAMLAQARKAIDEAARRTARAK